jgi:hypothetical protein
MTTMRRIETTSASASTLRVVPTTVEAVSLSVIAIVLMQSAHELSGRSSTRSCAKDPVKTSA